MTTAKPNKLYNFILPLLWKACDDDDDDQLAGWYNRSHLKCVKTTKFLVVCNKVANNRKCYVLNALNE